MAEFEKVHADLKALKQFCVRCGKQPYIHDGKRKNTFTSSGWQERPQDRLTFAEALEALQKPVKVYHNGKMQPVTGIGFLVARDEREGPQILGGDLDCCRDPETGFVSSWAASFLQQVKPFYSEVSPSKCGIRFFSWGHLPSDRDHVFGNGNNDLPEETQKRILAVKPKAAEKLVKGEPAFNGLELYESGRHLTITGDRLDDYCFPKEDQTSTISTALVDFLVAETVEKVANDIKKFKAGNILPQLDILSVIDTRGFSEGGGQLFGPHPTLHSTSGRNLVVNPSKNVYCYMHNGVNAGGDPWTWLACECGAIPWEQAGAGVLKDRVAWKKTLEFAVSKGLISAEEAGLNQRKKASSPSGLSFDDVATMEARGEDDTRVIFRHSDAAHAIVEKLPVAYSEDGRLYYWHGQTWKPDAEATIHNELDALVGNDFNTKLLREVLALVKSRLSSDPRSFDPYPELLGLKNGVLNCRTGEFKEYQPEDFITDQIQAAYDQKARCPEIIKFIEGLTPNYDDRITLLDIIASGAYRKALYYIAFLIGHGSSGSTRFIELIQAFYGTKTTEAVPLDELVGKQFALSALKDARYSIGQEIDEVKQAGTSRIKEVSGGDWISADVKNKDRARFRGWTKLLFKGNSIPRFTDNSWGFKRRFVEVPLPYRFVQRVNPSEPDQRLADPNILDKITSPEELSGLLNVIALRLPWIIENRQIYRRSGQFDAYKRQVDSVTTFLEEFCTFYPDAISVRVPIKELHMHFEKWGGLIKGNLVERRQFGSYVKRYCNNRPSLETTINNETATVYPGLAFDKEKFELEIAKLESPLKTGLDRIGTGSNTGLKSSLLLSNTGLTGLKSIFNPNRDITAKTLWDEIVSFSEMSFFSRKRVTTRLCSGDPVNDMQRPFDGDRITGSTTEPIREEAIISPVYPIPAPEDIDTNPVSPEQAARLAESCVEVNPGRDIPTPCRTVEAPVRVRLLKEYRTQIPRPGDPNAYDDHLFRVGEEAEFRGWKAENLRKRGIVELVA